MDDVTGATRAWRALPRATRADVIRRARAGESAADPRVVPIAAAWAATRPAPEDSLLMAVVPLAYILTTVVLTVGRAHLDRSDIDLVVLLYLVPVPWYFTANRWAPQVAAANLNELVGHDAPRGSVPLAVTATARPYWFRWALGACIVAAAIPAAVVFSTASPETNRIAAMAAVLLPVLGIGLVPVLLMRRSRPEWVRGRPAAGQPVLTLDRGGVHLPTVGVSAAWCDVAAAGFRPTGGGVSSPLGVYFEIDDLDALLVATTLNQRQRVRLSRRLRDRTLSLPAHWLDQDLALIVGTARALIASANTTPDTYPAT